MADETITPEQWRKWMADPCTKVLRRHLKSDLETFERSGASAQAATVRHVLEKFPRPEQIGANGRVTVKG